MTFFTSSLVSHHPDGAAGVEYQYPTLRFNLRGHITDRAISRSRRISHIRVRRIERFFRVLIVLRIIAKIPIFRRILGRRVFGDSDLLFRYPFAGHRRALGRHPRELQHDDLQH